MSEFTTAKRVSRSSMNNYSGSPANVQAVGNQPAQYTAAHPGLNFAKIPVQPKLKVSQPGDFYEQEADRVADQVIFGSAAYVPEGRNAVFRNSAGNEPNNERLNITQKSEATSDLGISNGITDRILDVSSGSGSRLDSDTRHFMESRFGYDFGEIRIHADGGASGSASDINARAYALGKNIVFGEGQYQPHTSQGRWLLAHELAHTIQQDQTSALQAKVIQRDLAIEPTEANPAEVNLTADQIRNAMRLNSVMFTDEAEIEIVRDVLGISAQPAVVDVDFVNAVVRYQSSFGLTPDGMLGPDTSERLSQEITAEADYLGEPAAGTPLRRVARRLHLRSMTSRRRGRMTHQGFVGPDDNPEGAVTVRVGDRQGAATNAISLEYTGENSNNVNWLQFINMQMFATPPGAAAPVFNAGAVATTGGNVTWSNAATTNWFVDALPASASPLYNVSGGLNTRAAARRIAMFDQPGGPSGLPVAQAFAAPGAPAAGATTVTMRMRFDAYVVRNNRARYHVRWTATTTYNIAAGTSSNIVYLQGTAGTVSGLSAVHRTALLAEYPGNPIR